MPDFGGLTNLDLGIIVAYFLLIVAAGVVLARRASKGIPAYFLGGRTIPWWAMGMSGTASNFDMTGTMVIISFVYAIGLQGFWVSMRGGMCLPLGVLMVYMGKWLRRSNVMTTAEWMELRFGTGREGSLARLLSAVSNLVVTMAFLVYFVKGTGKFLSVFLPFEPDTCALLMIGIAITYTTLSGFFGVIYTDVLQEVMILIASIYVGYRALMLPGHTDVLAFAGSSWSSFAPNWTAEPMTWLANPDIYHMFGLCVVFWVFRGIFEGVGGLTGGYMPQRYYAARSDREAGLLTAEWILLLLFRWMLIVGAALLALGLSASNTGLAETLRQDPEQALPLVLSHALPAGIRGLLVAGLIAAAMSTFDSTVNAGVSYWTRDIYQRYLKPQASDAALMRQSYGGTLVFALIAVALALGIKNINEIWSWITGPLSAGLFGPIILRWYWWRFNGYGFALSTATGLIVSLGTKLLAPGMPFYLSFVITLAASVAAGIIGSCATAPTAQATLVRFWRRVRPFGLWRPVVRDVDPDTARCAKRESGTDGVNVVLAIPWHVTGVVAVISLLLHRWTACAVSGAAFLVLGCVLYLTWYRNLQAPNAAAVQARERLES
jgi:Na+/proline symporter